MLDQLFVWRLANPWRFPPIEGYPAVLPMAGSPLGYDKLLGMRSHSGSK